MSTGYAAKLLQSLNTLKRFTKQSINCKSINYREMTKDPVGRQPFVFSNLSIDVFIESLHTPDRFIFHILIRCHFLLLILQQISTSHKYCSSQNTKKQHAFESARFLADFVASQASKRICSLCHVEIFFLDRV